MKIFISPIIILLFIFTHDCVSQNNLVKYSEFGLKTSVYSVTHRELSSFDDVSILGNNFGLRFVHVEEKNLGVLIEALYHYQKDDNYLNSYLQIPVLTHICFPISKSEIAINAGAYFMPVIEKDPGLFIERDFYYGLAAGLNYKYSVKMFNIGLEARYNFNLPTNSTEEDASTIRNSWLEFSLIVSLRKKK